MEFTDNAHRACMHSLSSKTVPGQFICMPVCSFPRLICKLIRIFVFIRDCNYLFGTVHLFGPSARGHNCNKCACVCCMSSTPTSIFPFIYPLLVVRFGHISISIQYDSMFAFFHLSCMHRARRIILTAFVFQFQIEYVLAVTSSYAMYRIAEPIVVAFLHVLH